MHSVMTMKHKLVCFVAVVAMVTSCIAVDEFSPKQRIQIENYLNNNQLEYSITSDSAYVHLAGNKYLAEGELRRGGAEVGNKVTFNFEAYTFSSAPATTPYYTNKRYLAESLTNINTSYWNFEPREVRLGDGEILNSLEESLEGSIAGDSLAVFLTSSIAYGEGGMGTVPANTAVMFVLTVEKIEE